MYWCNIFRTVNPPEENFLGLDAPEYLETRSSNVGVAAAWMHSALNHGVFDDVVVPPVPLKVMVKAGDAVGVPRRSDLADEDNYPQIVHRLSTMCIELLSLNDVPDVVANVRGLKQANSSLS
ncbi:hypothetical protein ACLBOM_37590 [Escherichia coli]